jgi:pSer/pThr/pTyr-binding forkhead associated (FHA) protein
MGPTGFFTIHVDGPGSRKESTASRRTLDEIEISGGGYSVRVGWGQGGPYLTDLGSADSVLVNASPLESQKPVALQAGDTIRLGNLRLTWRAGTGTEQPSKQPAGTRTHVLPRETVELPERQSPPQTGDKAGPPAPTDATLLVPKEVADQVRAAVADPTLLAPQKTPQAAAPETPEPTLLIPRQAAKTSAEKTVIPDSDADTTDETATYRTAWVDMAQLLNEDVELESVSTTILRDTRLPHLVVHLPDRTWEVQFSQESMTVGRGEANDITLPDESVSHCHALIERQGDDYVIRDAGGRNGLWLGKRRLQEHKLRDGDVVSLGRARLVFKGGFSSDELTLIGPPRIDGKPARRPVVFVPGLMGSELWLGSERLWPDARTIVANPEIYCFPGDSRIQARGILNDVVIVPNIIQLRQYSGLGDYLVADLGYTRGKDLLEFGYDWRHDVRLSAQCLAEAIEGWPVKGPITIIGHSLGTLVTRYYVEKLGGKRFVERIILMGGPHYGTPGGLAAILAGPGLLPFGLGDERLRAVLATFPSAYQILPVYPCVFDQNGNQVDVLEDESWLPEPQRPYLRAARSFRRELGTVSSVPAVSIFGYGLKTKLRVQIQRQPNEPWHRVDFVEDTAGDQSVPSGSAVLKDSEIHPVFQEHGSLYVDDGVRMRLKVELTRSTTWRRRK